MVEIIPAILPKTFVELELGLGIIQEDGGTVQIDVVDGVFAKPASWPFGARDSFDAFASGDEGLPFWGQFDFQFDVMVEHPEHDVERFVGAGVASIVVHAKSAGALEAVRMLQQCRGRELAPVEVGVALLPGAGIEELRPFEGLYDFVQVMGIAKVGAQGHTFDERAVTLVQELRNAYPLLCIQVDGGVTLETIPALALAGAQRLVAGHAIFQALDPVEEISNLRRAAQIQA
jgi:ribulose-phosphate 3-epimerase